MLSIIIISTNLMIPFYTVVAAETNCSNGDIVIAQSRVGTLPSGIPSFSVEITNACARACSISNLRLKCGMFASAVLVNPKIFKRQVVDDCLVNGGSPLAAGSTISFNVEITNACARGYSISNLRLKCGMFASAVLPNPKIFKRQDVDDCLVNGGSPLAAGSTISFKYANTFQYPLSLASATCG
ncbi:hypothetical protein VitviT2T_001570 [Vitis vinifera]|uniref:TPD1 protein-like 1 n=1 Tax=Vitis vinifera TaxID=29760 RepID=A0ABY9BFU6_VITVI|nr:hypothetical protein VitviT2T_001570 [Vitis vinifera]